MNTRFSCIAAAVAVLVGTLATGVPGARATAAFDYDSDVHSTLSIEVTGDGLVTGTPGENGTPSCRAVQNGPGCYVAYTKNALVNLHAVPDAGWILTGWSGCLHTTGAYCQVYMAEKPDTTYDTYWVSATFTRLSPTPTQQPLTVSVNGPGKVTGRSTAVRPIRSRPRSLSPQRPLRDLRSPGGAATAPASPPRAS